MYVIGMDQRLRELAEMRYRTPMFLQALFELAVEEQWFDLQHMVQHDMAKAILADYSMEQGRDYLDQKIYLTHWEDVIEVGWSAFCAHTGLTREKVNERLQSLHNGI
jgi:hypothetical protein